MCWIFLETLPIWLPIRCPFKKIVYASWKVLKICLRVSKRWLWSFRKSVRHFPREQLLHDVTTVLKFRDIERFHSRDQHLCKFMGTKESVYIRKEINAHRIDLEHQHGCRFIVLGHHAIWPPWSQVKTLYSGLYRAFSHDVTSAILVFQTNGTVAILLFQTSPVGV